MVKTAPTDTETYIVEGIWVHDNSKSELSDDQYGNGFLYDPSSGNRIEHYGMLKDEETFNSAIATWKSKNTFTNPKEFQSFINQFEEGDKIELGVVYNSKYDNYYSFFIRRTEVKANINYEATTDFNADGGTVTIDNASKLHYGEEVTINITTQDGYKVGSVKHNDTVINAADGVYKFTVVPGPNKISVNFVEDTGGGSTQKTVVFTFNEQTHTTGKQWSPIDLDDVITIKSLGGSTDGFFNSSKQWMLYQSYKGGIEISASSGHTIVSVKITFGYGNSGILLDSSNKTVSSGTIINVDAQSVKFTVSCSNSSKTNGQIKVTELEVVYK